MDLTEIISALQAERKRLDSAISVLDDRRLVRQRRGLHAASGATGPKARRRFSAATRRKIAKATKGRWAKIKASGKRSL
jgi:hypothetical protein